MSKPHVIVRTRMDIAEFCRGEGLRQVTTSFGESDYEDLIVNDIAMSDDWTRQIIVGDSPFALPAGLIWFKAQAGGNDAR